MKRLIAWVLATALTLGGPGLFLIAFLDSSFLSFPEVVDILMMGLVTKHKERMLYYALMPTIGSVIGCFALYLAARKGGETFLRKRLKAHYVDRVMTVFQKYGLLAVALPSILPPPVPFKAFVIAAGVARVPPLQFLVAVTAGRGVRYFGEALLAVWYGDRAAAFLSDHTRDVLIVLIMLGIVGVTAWLLWAGRRRRGRSRDVAGAIPGSRPATGAPVQPVDDAPRRPL